MESLLRFYITWLLDCGILVWFFRELDSGKNVSRVRRGLSALTFLLLLVLSPSLAVRMRLGTMTRFAIRAAAYTLYLYLSGRALLADSAYFGLYGTFLFNSALLISRSRVFFNSVIYREVTALPWVNAVYSAVVESLIILAVFLSVQRIEPVKNHRKQDLTQWIALGMVCAGNIYSTNNMYALAPTRADTLPINIDLFILLLNVFMMLFHLLYRHYFFVLQRENEIIAKNALNELRLKTIEQEIRHDREIRVLSHDMKNHLLAIRSMLRNSADKDTEEYISSLLSGISQAGTAVKTGNEFLDALLTQKISEAEKNGIRFSCVMDFSHVDFITNLDLCTIFGNAVDNAVEACMKQDLNQGRFISIQSRQDEEYLYIIFVNSRSGRITLRNGIPSTTKTDAGLHGIGISSVRDTVKKYGGRMSIDLEDPALFRLSIYLPLRQNNDQQ